jgi:hypothetical protein
MRKLATQQILNPKKTEDWAWTHLKNSIEAATLSEKNCIIESTGTIHRLRDLWTPELANRGIYTIKFTASIEICQERARQRARKLTKGYNLDESYAILIDNIEQKFEEIEWHILRAMKCFEVYKTMELVKD